MGHRPDHQARRRGFDLGRALPLSLAPVDGPGYRGRAKAGAGMTGMTIGKDRIAHGLCPQCGKEAAPFYLCWQCRLGQRFNRSLKKGVRCGVVNKIGEGRKALFGLEKGYSEEAERQWGKHSIPIVIPESDSRGHPRIRGTRVNVEATLIRVIEFIGHPCTLEEIMTAWGRLRSKRDAPLHSDLGRIIIASERRKTRNAKRAALSQPFGTPE